MQNFRLICCVVFEFLANKQTDKQTNRQTQAFYIYRYNICKRNGSWIRALVQCSTRGEQLYFNAIYPGCNFAYSPVSYRRKVATIAPMSEGALRLYETGL